MELIETRKAYMEEQGNPLGLLFVKSEKSKSQVLISLAQLPHERVRLFFLFVMGMLPALSCFTYEYSIINVVVELCILGLSFSQLVTSVQNFKYIFFLANVILFE